jgi:hypothetical protein
MAEFILEEDYPIPETPFTELPEGMLQKLTNAAPILQSSYNIPVDKYTTVYATSDIHADLKAISNILYSAGLITESIGDTSIRNIFNVRWNPTAKNTLLIIAGDIVDGKRRDGNQVDDPTGDIEVLLHIFLYNLRVSAREVNSELRFTIGNHDYYSVFMHNHILLRYIHDKANELFMTKDYRSACLLPFYRCCPYICITIGSELMFIHASYHDKTLTKPLNDILELQEKVDTTDYDNIIDVIIEGFKGTVIDGIDSRPYVRNPASTVCEKLKKSPYRLIVVGHCQTNVTNVDNIIKNEIEKDKTNNCTKGGCVVLGCADIDGPRIAFVDISMSKAFIQRENPTTKETLERYEILKIELDNEIKRVSRVHTHDGTNDEIIVWYVNNAYVNNANTGCSGASCSIMGGNRKRKTKDKRRIRRTKKVKKVKNGEKGKI